LLDAATTFFIRVAGAGLAFALQALLARIMAPEAYGGYVVVWSWLLACGSLASLGLAEAAVRFLPRYESQGRQATVGAFFRFGSRAVVAASAAISGVALLALAAVDPIHPMAQLGLFIAAALPFLAMEFFLEGVARAMGWFRITSVAIYVIRPLAIGGLCLAAHGAGITITAAVAALILTAVLAVTDLALFAIIHTRLKHRTADQPARRRRNWLWLKASLPMLLASGLEDIISAGDTVMAGLLIGPADAALYFAATRVLALAFFAQYAVQFVAGRRFSLALSSSGGESPEAAIRHATATSLVATLAALAITLLAGPLALAAFGASFAAAYPVMAILAVGLVFRAAGQQVSELLLVSGSYRSLVACNGVALAVLVAGAAVLTLNYGLFGVAGAAVGAQLVRSACLIVAAKSVLGISLLAGAKQLPPKVAEERE
jgi:O-antigen/teichoic acid export membrane protein